ncbi:cell division protein FtsZ [Treponema porcinum]|uniref:Cell division protein FtsZ n=1 Tax=Treponema porcinum TaxID=261392 RepID=A0A1T4KY76_TREPO|nr:cell division protein FtsZ [Treponema porcinum]SJZ47404.1 cell division protein FtsZ [Treponema porcinum]
MNFEVLNNEGSDLNAVSPTVIKVVGCGGGGSNAVNRMIEADIKNVDFIALNTDLQALNKSNAKSRLAIGQKITQGLGAGGDPLIGEKAAEEDKDAISNILKGANMVFVTAGMGGGTGTGSAPVVAKIAREIGALTVGIVTTPFPWEGPQRMKLALDGIQRLREAVDSVIVIPNAKIVDVFGQGMSFKEQLRAADDMLRQSIEGMSMIITQHGTPNIDFADVRAAMKGQGTAIFGIGTASGENRAVDAATKAINNPLLEDTRIDGAKHFLINVCASSDFTLNELTEISNIVCASASPAFDLKPGVVTDDSMGDTISVTVIATGFGSENETCEKEPAEQVSAEEINPVKEDDNVFSDEEYSKLLSGKTQVQNELFSTADTVQAEPDVPVKDYGSFKKADANSGYRSSVSVDVNDLNTPACLRKNLSRTINFDRK